MDYHCKKIIAATAIAGSLLAAVGSQEAHALDVDPGDYAAAPPGTSLAILYGLFGWNDAFKTDGGDDIDNSNLNTQVGILRMVHYVELAGITIDPQIFLPWGSLNNGQIGGDRLSSSTGFGDIIVAATAWLINQPEEKRWLGFTPFFFFPTGTYKDGQVLNVGENRFKYVLQFGFVQGFEALDSNWMVDLIADTTFYGNNEDAGENGNQTLRQNNSYQVQAWLRYFIQDNWAVGPGYSGTWGGKQRIAGDSNDVSTETQQLRLITQYYPEPTLQLQAATTTDVYTRGGFQESFGLNLRVMKIF